jgi:hypothetical protein
MKFPPINNRPMAPLYMIAAKVENRASVVPANFPIKRIAAGVATGAGRGKRGNVCGGPASHMGSVPRAFFRA